MNLNAYIWPIFIIVFGLFLFVHEFGHYLASKLLGIEVEEFGFGFPPKVANLFKIKETQFTLNAIPFGAFVKPKGEADTEVPGGMAAASPWVRLGVLLAGPAANIVVGILIFSLVYTQVGVPVTSKVVIYEVNPGSPAEIAGIQKGDRVLTLAGQPVTSIEQMMGIVVANKGKKIAVTLDRNGSPISTTTTPRLNPPPNEGPMGIALGNPRQMVSWIQSLGPSVNAAYTQAQQFILLPVMILRGQVASDQVRVGGPVMMKDMLQAAIQQDVTNQSQESSPLNTLLLLAVLSIAIGLTNLLPIPALDGGRILFVLPELLLRKRVPQKYENLVHLVGFVALILFMVYVTFQDIVNPISLPK